MATDGIISYLIYLYDTLQWHRSSFITNKMSSPQVGFAIDGTVLTMPQSGSSDALSLTYSSNKHVPGMTLYAVPGMGKAPSICACIASVTQEKV